MYGRILHQKPFISFKNTDKEFIKTKKISNRISQRNKFRLEDWYWSFFSSIAAMRSNKYEINQFAADLFTSNSLSVSVLHSEMIKLSSTYSFMYSLRDKLIF